MTSTAMRRCPSTRSVRLTISDMAWLPLMVDGSDGGGRYRPMERPMISFMISVVPP